MTASLGVFQEMTARIYMHSARFYLVASLIAPLWLAASSRILKARRACTIFAAAFTAIFLTFVWILPLFPAEPKLGPVYQPVTRLIPPDFPLLLLAPALALDLLRPRFSRWNRWVQSAIAGIVFLAVFMAAQWPFANFLMSPASRNWIFATQYIPFFVPPDSDYARNVFTPVEHSASQFGLRMALALAAAVLTSRLGLAWGESMQKIKR